MTEPSDWKRFVEDLEKAHREGSSLFDVIMPDGRRLGACTKREFEELYTQTQLMKAAWGALLPLGGPRAE